MPTDETPKDFPFTVEPVVLYLAAQKKISFTAVLVYLFMLMTSYGKNCLFYRSYKSIGKGIGRGVTQVTAAVVELLAAKVIEDRGINAQYKTRQYFLVPKARRLGLLQSSTTENRGDPRKSENGFHHGNPGRASTTETRERASSTENRGVIPSGGRSIQSPENASGNDPSDGPDTDPEPKRRTHAGIVAEREEMRADTEAARLSGPDMNAADNLMGEVEAKVKAQRIERGDPPDPPES